MTNEGVSKIAPKSRGLFDFKQSCLLRDNVSLPLQPPLFGNFHVWVLERWKYASGDGPSRPKDYVNSGDIKEEELEDFLKRKVMSMKPFWMVTKSPRNTASFVWILSQLVLSLEGDYV
jgi:hypothetical protein